MFANIIERIGQNIGFKMFAGIASTWFAFFFDQYQKDALLALLILILMDFVFAISVAYKKKIEIRSRRVCRTAWKVVIYFGLIAAAHLAEKGIMVLSGVIDETVTGFLIATELISIMEHIGNLGYAIPKKLLNQLTKFTDKQ